MEKLHSPKITSDDLSQAIFEEMMLPPKTKTPHQISETIPIVSIFGLNEKDKSILQKFIDERSYEVEASFGYYNNVEFIPSISSHAFKKLYEWFIKRNKTPIITNTKVDINANIRKITNLDDNSIIYQNKKKINMFDYYDYGFRVRVSKEEKSDEKEWSTNRTTTQRIRKKYTFDEEYFIVELNFVQEYHYRFVNKQKTSQYDKKFEVEIEVKNNKVDVSLFIDKIKEIYDVMFSFRGIISSLDERVYATKGLYKLLDQKYESIDLPIRFWNKPVNLRLDCLLSKKFEPAITIKLDGSRGFLFIYNDAIFLCVPPDYILIIEKKLQEYSGSLIDGEFMTYNDEDYFFAFDILYYKNNDVRNNDFKSRLDILESVKIKPDPLNYSIKTFYFTSGIAGDFVKSHELLVSQIITYNFYDAFKKSFEDSQNTPFPTDGFIFQSAEKYMNNNTWKWKPTDKMTIDFYITNDPTLIGLDKNEDSEKYLLFCLNRGHYINFLGSQMNKFNGFIKSDTISEFNNRIVEMKWDYTIKNFVAVRFRFDRNEPNAINVALDVWKDIHHPISLDTLLGDGSQLFRRYSNIIKSDLLKHYFKENNIILDIGSGRGGDVKKWKDIGFNKVYAIEPNNENIQELERRLKNVDIQVQIINDSIENTDSITTQIDDIKKIDGVVSFFSLTFLYESKEKFGKFIDTIDKILNPSKFFIGIVFDGKVLRKELSQIRIANSIPNENAVIWDNSVFNISEVSEFDEDPFGNEILITMKDPHAIVQQQNEWLVDFDVLVKELELRDIILRKTYILNQGFMFHALPELSQLLSSMNRVFVFQKLYVKQESVYGDIVKINSLFEWCKDLYHTLTPESPSSFIYSVLRGVDEEFMKLEDSAKDDYIIKFRKEVSKIISMQQFKNIRKGSVFQSYFKALQNEKKALSEFKKYFSSPEQYLDKNAVLILSEFFKVNIWIMQSNGEIFGFSDSCNESFNSSIVLYTNEDFNHYDLVLVKKEDEFTSKIENKSLFYQNILVLSCQNKN